MQIDEERKARGKRTLQILLASGLSGLALIMFPHVDNYHVLWEGTVTELGKALVIAAVLGAIIDGALKRDLVRDAVSASIGYLLPEQLRNEMHWVYGQKVIANQTWHMTLNHVPEHRTVIVRGTYDRVIRNITDETQKVRLAGGTDEWCNAIQKGEITTAEYRRFKNGKYGPVEKLERREFPTGHGYGNEELVEIAPGELIHLSCSYIIACPDHGQESLTYRYPVENPVVQVEVPPTLRAHIAISHREPSHPYTDFPDSRYLTSRLNGTLLPHQDIHVLWHRADEI